MKASHLQLLSILFLLLCIFPISIYPATPDTSIITQYIRKASYYQDVNPDSAFFFSNKAIQIAEKENSKSHISLATQQLGLCYIEKENFTAAIQLIFKALKIEESLKNNSRIAELNNDLGYIHNVMEKYPVSLNYFTAALKIYTQQKDTIGIAKTLTNIGSLNQSREFCEARTEDQKKEDYNLGLELYFKALNLYKKINNEPGIYHCYSNIGNTLRKVNRYQEAIDYQNKALGYYRTKNNWKKITNMLRLLGITYTQLKEYNRGIKCYNECVEISNKYNLKGGIQFLYMDMAQTYENAGNFKLSRDYYVKYMILRDSIYNSEKSKQFIELETKYQVQKKENEIVTLTLLKKKKNFFIGTLLFLITIIGFSAFFTLQSYRSKRIIAEQQNKLNEQKIKELEKERQLLAMQSVLQGEDAERTRLARDLHDGLGGLLSGVKLKLTSLKGNYIVPQTNENQFDHAVNLLDNSIKELRRVAHNMMPEALVKFGLKDALHDFCGQISTGKELRLSFQHFGESTRLEQTLETSIYRITQELVNNALKHAQASEIIVQLMQETNRVHLTVQDNGKGFDPKQVDVFKSAGLQNIKARVETFNGRFDIDSTPGKGTEIGVEFRIG